MTPMPIMRAPLLQSRVAAVHTTYAVEASQARSSRSNSSSSRHQQRGLSKRLTGAWLILLCCTTVLVLGWQAARLSQWSRSKTQALDDSLAAALLDAAEEHAAAPGVKQLAYPVWWHAPYYSGTGYSTEAISYVVSLLQTNRFRRQDIWISHSGDQIVERVASSMEPETRQLLEEQEYNNLVRGRLSQEELERPAIVVCHSFPDCWMLSKDQNSMNVPGCPCPPPEAKDLIVYRVGRTMFETNSLPAHLVEHCNAMHEVWVPTEFNRATFTAAGVAPEKLFVVPQGIDAAQFDPAAYQPLLLRELPGTQLVTGSLPAAPSSSISSSSSTASSAGYKPFVFMSVFKWETRKGWDVLLEAYLHEFKAEEHVELHIMTKPFGKGRENFRDQVLSWLQRRLSLMPHQAASLPRMFVHSQHVDDATYPRLYISCDCVVLPTRGEGWGRPQMEAMSMAKPVITTNWSGPTAYINGQVAYPLSIEHLAAADADMNLTVADARDINPYFKGQHWAQPSVTHLKQLMRHVFTNPQEAAAKGRAARTHIQAHFTPQVLANVVMSEIMRIQDKLGLNRTMPPKAERAEVQPSKALCVAYPDLCKQGPAGMAEAARRAKSSFSQYRTNQNLNSDLSMQPGRMTVAEMIARSKKGEHVMGVTGIS